MTSTRTPAQSAPAAAPEPPAAAVALDAHWAAKQERLRDRKNATRTLRICDADDLKVALDEATRAHRLAAADVETQADAGGNALKAAKARLTRAEAALADAQQQVEDATITLTFRALHRTAYDALVKAHPPTEAQAEDGDEWNYETFAPALVAAASVDGMPLEDATTYLAEWGPAEAVALFQTALFVQQRNRMDLGKG